MRVTVEVVGEGTHAVELDEPAESTYGDLLREVGLNRHEASVLVDGRPVPEDAPVEAESVRVLRLIKGG
ncbi:ubiquitin-like small modifier protein 2 [Halomarina halobia]|uniref:Ubiquitin-like small modifier protein 2 n=1 Tax=Halomarina halobia TaxID=3033386 RepID=A0ABD6A8F3_9EURY|nr:ubiquitin-like small modifier protein 2 [Halomarina sp. PSR21]